MKLLWILLCLFFVSPSLSAEGFWTVQELSEEALSELDGVVQLRFKDAVSAKPIPQLTVELAGNLLSPDARGVISLPLSALEDTMEGRIPFRAAAPGYIALDDSLNVLVGTVVTKRFVLSPDLPVGQVRFVLEWEKRPSDLDAWLTGPNFTVSYRSSQNSSDNARLDQDARSGFGPETITLLGVAEDKSYVFSVANYSHEAPMRNVKFSVYANGRLARVFSLAESSDRKLDVVRIHKGRLEYLLP